MFDIKLFIPMGWLNAGLAKYFFKKVNADIGLVGIGNAEFQRALDHEHMFSATVGAFKTQPD